MNVTPQDPQKARREAAERFYAIGMLALPAGWTFAFRKRLSGVCDMGRQHIVAPKPVTRRSLYIWLHECAHAHLHWRPSRTPRYLEEMEAEQWAHTVMRNRNIAVPRDMTRRAKIHVAKKIRQARARGAKKIDPRALNYLKGYR